MEARELGGWCVCNLVEDASVDVEAASVDAERAPLTYRKEKD